VLGFIVGPVVGAVADLTSIEGVFLAVAVLSAALSLLAVRIPPGPRELPAPGALHRALRDNMFLVAVWLTLVPALFFGALDVLAPLALADAGWSTVAIAATFAAAGLAEVALAPLVGALSDRRGRLYPVRLALWGLTGVALALAASLDSVALLGAALVLCASVVTSFLYTPSIALVSDRAEASGMPQTLGFGVMNSSWALGAMVGPAGGGALAGALGTPAPLVASAVLALATGALLARPGWQVEPA